MEERSLARQETIIEQKSKTGTILNKYLKGRYLGKGGFAKCYEFTNLATAKKYAAKIVQKATLTRSKAKEKLASQIEIHKSIKSQFVVKYERSFEDQANVYIILELCTNQTLNQLIKRRKRITEIEARYYLRQISLAIKDFQEQMVIHRDLKLGNLLLTQNLQIRISDFGLAAKLNHPGQRRKTMCGTPNYIAPQILQNNTAIGHSYQVDIWSLGVIAYACLVGRPPFETNDVKTTYNRIKMCNYSFPDHISISTVTKHFISKMLQKDPRHRLSVDEILSDEFFSLPIPEALPTTLLACPPNAHFLSKYQVPTLQLKHRQSTQTQSTQKTQRVLEKGQSAKTLMRTNSIEQLNKPNFSGSQRAASTTTLARGRMLSSKIQAPKCVPSNPQHHQQAPFVWVTLFQENPKFGTAYILNSNSLGMKFNDSTCLIANNYFLKMKYIDLMNRCGQQPLSQVFQVGLVPEKLSKKYKIISYYQKELKTKKQIYQNGLNNEQIIEKQKYRFKQTPENAMNLWVTKLYKTSKAHFFWFNNKDYQVIFQDNTQLLFSKELVTYVNKLGQRIYFNKNTLQNQPEEIKKRANYAANSLQTIRQNSKGANKENNNMVRSSSVIKMEKPQPVMLRGSASTSRIPPPRVLKY